MITNDLSMRHNKQSSGFLTEGPTLNDSKLALRQVPVLINGNYKWVLPQPLTLSNAGLVVSMSIYGFGFSDFFNEVFNNNKPRVIREYGFKGTKLNGNR